MFMTREGGGSGLGMFQRFSLARSVYPFNTPGAFVPHSAINLSRTKEEESPVSQSLDLTVSESGQGPPALVSVSTAGMCRVLSLVNKITDMI